MKNKNQIIVLIVIAVLIVGALAFFALNRKAAPVQVTEQVPVEEKVSTIKPEDIGLTLTATQNNQKVILEVANTTGIAKLDYELDYTKKGDIPVGVIGEPTVKPGQPVKQEIVLGTCSDVCHYDEDVSNIKLTLKVTKTDGSVSQTVQTLDLNQ